MNIRKILCLIALLLLLPVSFAGEEPPESYFDFDTNLYGLKDAKENVVLEPTFDTIEDFNEGYAVVTLDNLSGIVNEQGKITMYPTYSYLSRIKNGLSIAFKDDMAGAVNVYGKVIIPFEYENMSLFIGENTFAIKGGKIGIISKENKLIKDFIWDDIFIVDFAKDYTTFVYKKDGQYGVANFEGTNIYGPVDQELLHLGDDKVAVSTETGFGVVDFKGNQLVEAKYGRIYAAGRGYIAKIYDEHVYVYLDASGKEVSSRFYSETKLNDHLRVYSTDNGDGLFDLNQMKEIMPAKYSAISLITDHGSPAKQYLKFEIKGEDWSYNVGLADLNGNVLIEANKYDLELLSPGLVVYQDTDYNYGIYSLTTEKDSGAIYESVERIENDDYLIVENFDYKYGILDIKGNVQVATEAERISDKSQFYTLKKDDKYALFNKKTRHLSSYKYDGISDFNTVGETEVAMISINNKSGFLKADENYLLEPIYDDVDEFVDGFARIRLNNLTGLIDEKGKVILKPKYDRIYDFKNDLAIFVIDNGKYGYLNKNGSVALPAKYDYADDFSSIGYASVKIDDKMGLINKKGIFTIPAIYDEIIPINENLIMVLDAETDKYGVVKPTGEIVIKPIYDEIGSFELGGVIPVKLNSKYALMNEKAEILTLFKFDSIEPFYDDLSIITIGGREGVMNVRGEYILK